MVEWLAGNRIRGTSTERTSTSGFNPIPAEAGGWKELGRTTLGSAGDTITVSSLPDKQYYMLLTDNRPSGNLNVGHRAGNGSIDTGSNYAKRPSINGASDITHHVNNNNFLETDGLNHTDNMFSVNYLSNKSDKEKLGIGHSVRQNTAGAGNAPNRTEYVGKWANTSNVIDTLATVNFGTGDLASGSELVVLGWDEDDTHTDNFWEELASVELGSAGDTINSGTITAKKYLWVQIFKKGSGDCSCDVNFNSDTGSNYARRGSSNGGSDFTQQNSAVILSPNNTDNDFVNMFIVNNSANEKLIIAHIVDRNTAGAGNAPDRMEIVSKWVNTSSQITSIDVNNSASGDFDTGSILKVWGSD